MGSFQSDRRHNEHVAGVQIDQRRTGMCTAKGFAEYSVMTNIQVAT